VFAAQYLDFELRGMPSDKEQAMQEARSDVRNKAVALGATHVELQSTSNEKKGGVWGARYEITLSGVAYRCAK
jgi:Domain of unknown function (DUF4156)